MVFEMAIWLVNEGYNRQKWSRTANNMHSNSIKGMMSKCVKAMNLEQRILCLLNQHVLKTTPNIRTLHVPAYSQILALFRVFSKDGVNIFLPAKMIESILMMLSQTCYNLIFLDLKSF